MSQRRARRSPYTLDAIEGVDDRPREGVNYRRGGSKQDLPVIHCNGCWCGGRANHDWPGKTDGVPHPRVRDPLPEWLGIDP